MRIGRISRAAAAILGLLTLGWFAITAVPVAAAPSSPLASSAAADPAAVDLALTNVAIFGTPTPAPLSPGGVLQISGDVVNRGTAVTLGTLSLTLPAGLQLASAGVTRDFAKLNCSTTATGVSCDLGAVDPNESAEHLAFVANVARTRSAKIGDTLKVGVEIEPSGGPDANPADNTASVSILITGRAVLVVTLTPANPTVAPGSLKQRACS